MKVKNLINILKQYPDSKIYMKGLYREYKLVTNILRDELNDRIYLIRGFEEPPLTIKLLLNKLNSYNDDCDVILDKRSDYTFGLLDSNFWSIKEMPTGLYVQYVGFIDIKTLAGIRKFDLSNG